MLEGYGPIAQSLLGSLLTWGLTAAGAALVYLVKGSQNRLLEISLGFAAGVMLAASFWSLLNPAIEMATESRLYGENGELAFVPVVIGFVIGAAFVYGTDIVITFMGVSSPKSMLTSSPATVYKEKVEDANYSSIPLSNSTCIDGFGADYSKASARRRGKEDSVLERNIFTTNNSESPFPNHQLVFNQHHWRRMLLLIVAITVHNIPEGLSVGVAFGAIGNSASATLQRARNLAVGIGIQNFPEGLAVSLPLHAAGLSAHRSFFWGQLSGMVEPVAAVLGAAAVFVASPILPYALSFAAGAMVFVVIDDILPEAHSSGGHNLLMIMTTCPMLLRYTQRFFITENATQFRNVASLQRALFVKFKKGTTLKYYFGKRCRDLKIYGLLLRVF